MTLNMTFRFQTECKFLFCSRFVLVHFFLPPSLSHSFACIYSVYALFYRVLTQRATLRPVLMKRFFFSCSPCYSYISEFPFNLVWTHLKLGSIFRSHFLPSLVRFPTFHYLNRHSAVHMPMTKKSVKIFQTWYISRNSLTLCASLREGGGVYAMRNGTIPATLRSSIASLPSQSNSIVAQVFVHLFVFHLCENPFSTISENWKFSSTPLCLQKCANFNNGNKKILEQAAE